MRWLLGLVLVVAAAWSGLWFAGARMLDRAVADVLAQAGPGVAAEGYAVRGFPNRFDVTVTAPRLADAATGIAWSAPFVQSYALSYRPWHTIIAFPPEQRLAWPGGALTLRAGKLQASLVLRPGTALSLDRLTLVGEALEVRPDQGPGATVATLRFATRQDPTRAAAHEIGLAVSGIVPDAAATAALPPDAALSGAAAELRLVATAVLSGPIDRFAAKAPPALLRLDLTEVAFRWGGIVLSGSGTLAPDAAGLAEGRIDLRLDQWRQAIDVAVALGALRPEVAPTWTEFARRLSETGGSPDRLDLTLTLARGRISLGLLPIGPAPRLVP